MYKNLPSTKDWQATYDSLIVTCNLPTLEQRLKLSIFYQILNGNFQFPSAPIERRLLARNLSS